MGPGEPSAVKTTLAGVRSTTLRVISPTCGVFITIESVVNDTSPTLARSSAGILSMSSCRRDRSANLSATACADASTIAGFEVNVAIFVSLW